MTFEEIVEIDKLDQNGTYIWVIHADKIPPHLGISSDGEFFSLKVSGVDFALPADRLLKTFDKKWIPLLIIQTDSISVKDLLAVYSHYESAKDGGNTCLSPIKELFGLEQVNTIHELLRELKSKSQVKVVYGKNLPCHYKGIPEYDLDAVNERLRKLVS